jgi:tetratricopeptide (TPR) repeat protein
LDPAYATAHQWFGECLSWQGRFEEALTESERARQLDPLSMIIAEDHGAILYFSRQYDRAIEQFRTVREMDPDFPRGGLLLQAYVQKGQFSEALAQIGKPRTYDEMLWNLAYSAYVHGRSDQLSQGRRALARLKHLVRESQPDRTALLLLAYLGMDRKEEAITLLQKAYLEHSNLVTLLKVDPNYDSLRSDPRFQDLLRRNLGYKVAQMPSVAGAEIRGPACLARHSRQT